jgi:glycosyltransferase involved in cell wall biosynthesis
VIRHVAVIVPAADEEQRIGRCLASIATAARHLSRREAGIGVRVIVTLDSCQDATAAICATFPGVSTVAITSRNVGAARRAGTQAALAHRAGPPGELWLASTDADSAVPADWLTAMVGAAGRGVHLVLGTVLPGAGLSPAVRARWLAGHQLRDGHPHVHGANLGIRADAYLALGGWPPLAAGEDADLARRAAAAGWLRVSRTAAIPVVTSVRRAGRAPRGFSSSLRALDDTELAGTELADPGLASVGEADLDRAADLPHRERRLRRGGGTASHRAVRNPEDAAVPGAGQAAV